MFFGGARKQSYWILPAFFSYPLIFPYPFIFALTGLLGLGLPILGLSTGRLLLLLLRPTGLWFRSTAPLLDNANADAINVEAPAG